MGHLRDRAYELADKALRKLDGVPSEKNQLPDEDAARIRSYIERSRTLWLTPTEICYGLDGMSNLNVVKAAITKLKANKELIESALTDTTTLESRFTTLKHYHDTAPLKRRILFVVGEILGGGSKNVSRV